MKYVKDLMVAERALGHDVTALYPGGSSVPHGACYVHRDTPHEGIVTYEMSNPLPVPLLYGVKDVESEISAPNLKVDSFVKLLEEVKPDVFHVHTLMGLPLEYLRIAHDRGIRIVYTSHDYFGLCPKVNLINQNDEVCLGASSEKCAVCNAHAKSAWFLRLRNAKWIVPLKSFARRMKR